jgi:hypothetical protein
LTNRCANILRAFESDWLSGRVVNKPPARVKLTAPIVAQQIINWGGRVAAGIRSTD